MAILDLEAIVKPEIYADYGKLSSLEKNSLVTSGLAYTHPVIQAGIMGGGDSINLPYWNDLDYAEPTPATDNPDDKIVANTITGSKDVAFKYPYAKSISSSRLAIDWAGSDPAGQFDTLLNEFWQKHLQRVITNTCQGLFADSATNHDDDLVLDISAGDSETVVVADNYMDGDNFLGALGELGDRQMDITSVGMHSTVFGNLNIANQIDIVRDSDQNAMFYTYKGKRVILDDKMFSVTYGTPQKVKYTTILFGKNVFGFGAGSSKMTSMAYVRDELGGNGSGTDTVLSRRQYMLHPVGYTFDGASMAGNAPTLAELADGTMWTRNFTERKRIQMVGIISNG